MGDEVRLTEHSHGAGCGCKLSPAVLQAILAGAGAGAGPADPRLIVGTDTRDDAAVYDLGDGTGVISTTDFFMPIVDDPLDFGRVAATNAISDVYAMGGTPLLAIAILGWPVNALPAEVAGRVLEGGRAACRGAGIALAGGHSIDAPEPIFGLAVTGRVPLAHLKRNCTAVPGCDLWLTKPLGVGILTTAEKRRLLRPEHRGVALEVMTTLNRVGARLGPIAGVTALTDVTGFGLLGHLTTMLEGSGARAEVRAADVPLLPGLDPYIEQECWPGGTDRNWDSYGHLVGPLGERDRVLLCDPQTSGGLLAAVRPEAEAEFLAACQAEGVTPARIGRVLPPGEGPLVTVT
ncbi:MAG: selenide, water dikinase SelD [Planctomycetes bacterium]|nr:selenide, water dikinase SelD [Planctomycetota bacterium]